MKLSLVIPCYNEDSRGSGDNCLSSRLQRLREELQRYGNEVEVIFSDDCSFDDSVISITNFIEFYQLSNWRCIVAEENGGKGSAIYKGFSVAEGDFIGFMDADLSVDLNALHIIYPYLDDSTCYIASRFSEGSSIVNERPISRQVVSKIARFLLTSLFSLDVSDTQCGFKIFPSSLFNDIALHLYPSRWLFDVELLYGAKVCGVEIEEVPVIWSNDEKQSTLNIGKAILMALVDLVKIYKVRKCLDNEFGI